MPKNKCKGCELRVQFGRGKECRLTQPRVKDIKDCPCKECLVKMSCSFLCHDFVKVYNRYMKEYSKWFKAKVNSPRPKARLEPFPSF
jgi:hypothetical protein